MSIEINTRDCAVLSDAELAAMADLAEANSANFDIGYLSKAREDWVLVTDVKRDDELLGYSFYTLERIGGTPAVVIGVLLVAKNDDAHEVLMAVREGQFRKALLAFPDEDVLVGSKLLDVDAFEILQDLNDIVPTPGHKPSGEERAWARRLAKRYGGENRVDDRTFIFAGTGEATGYAAYTPTGPSRQFDGFADFFAPLQQDRNDTLIALGWIMAEDLAKFSGFDD